MPERILKGKVCAYRNYNLRDSLEDKLADLSPRHSVTIFVNRLHTLAHVFFLGENELYLRARLPKHLRHISDKALAAWLEKRFARWI